MTVGKPTEAYAVDRTEDHIGDLLLSAAVDDFERDGMSAIIRMREAWPEHYLRLVCAAMRMQKRNGHCLN